MARMRRCLKKAGVDDEGMEFAELKETYDAIKVSCDDSVTLDSDDSDNEDIVTAGPSDQSARGTAANDTDVMPWLSKPKAAAGAKGGSKFNYKIPKTGATMKVTALTALDDQHTNEAASASGTTRPARVHTYSAAAKNQRVENEFEALDYGDPRDLPDMTSPPLPLIKRQLSPEMVGANSAPPYNDPRVAALPYKERHAIIGQYLRDMQDMLYRLSRASSKKAPWGKPIQSSARYNGTLDKVPIRSTSQKCIDEMEFHLNPTIDSPPRDGKVNKTSVSSFENPFSDVIEREPSSTDTDDVRTNPRDRRKRKSTKDPVDSLSDSDGNSDIPSTTSDPDYEKKRKKTSTKSTKLSAVSDPLAFATGSDDGQSSTLQSYAEIMNNRPEVTLKAVRGSARGRGGRGRGRAGKGSNNADIMARSNLFKDSPIIKTGNSAKPAASRARRLLAICDAEKSRKAQEEKYRSSLENSIDNRNFDQEDQVSSQTVDDDGDFGKPDENFKRKRVGVPVPKGRPGLPRLPRKNPPKVESKLTSSDDDIIEVSSPTSSRLRGGEEEEEEEKEKNQPCPMCNVMFPISVIQDHAENCDGPDSNPIQSLTCEICDKVFLLSKEFEAHCLNCLEMQK